MSRAPGSSGEALTDTENRSTSDLEARLMEIDVELEKLSTPMMRSGVGNVGYRSKVYQQANSPEWIQLDLDQEQLIDQIIFVPVIWRDSKKGLIADGFPVEFRILAGRADDEAGSVLASFSAEDQLLPRIAPLVVAIPETTVSWVRIEVSQLSSSVWEEEYVLQLSEVLLFSGNENVALHSEVSVLSNELNYKTSWNPDSLVDGFVPYLLDAASGERSLAFVSSPKIGGELFLTIDLEASYPLNRIHIHRTDISDTIPPTVESDFGIARRILIEGANRADFSDAIALVEYQKTWLSDVGPVIKRRFQEANYRYVRLTMFEPYTRSERGAPEERPYIGFAEIELFSKGENVAIGKQARAGFKPMGSKRHISAITDGRNFYGSILDDRAWLNELAHRHQLEVERPLVAATLNQRYLRQKANLARLKWLSALLAAGIVITMLVDRIIRQRKMTEMRERLAADLHDELGANLHTIGLLSDLADESKDNPEEQSELHRRIRSETERSGNAVRRCTNMLEARGQYTGLAEDMQRTARRILGKLGHDLTIEGDEYLTRLKPRTGYDLFLFYKECLVNISRHSEATEFKTRLIGDEKNILLKVSDNGKGMANPADAIPSSLRRRARLLGAKVSVEDNKTTGVSICLTLKTNRATENL